MRTVIISDLHNHVDWVEDALLDIDHDKVVFLGDYFDDFHDNATIAEKTAKWLKQSLQFKNRVHLFGNHDTAYFRPHNQFAWCPGFDHEKCRKINSVLDANDWNKLRFCHYDQGWMISHAGAHERIFSHPIQGPSPHWIKSYCAEGLEALKSNLFHPSYQYSPARGMSRFNGVGGILWLDWFGEFQPIQNLNQIVGHTICRKWVKSGPIEHSEQSNPNFHAKVEVLSDEPLRKQSVELNSDNWNLDCRNRAIGLIEDGKFTWFKNEFLTQK